MDGPDVIFLARSLVAMFGLVFLARLLHLARAYISWRAFAFYLAALAALVVILVLRFGLFGITDVAVVRQSFETVLLVGILGSLLEHVRADQLRVRDSVRLLEQWRLSTGLAQRRTRELEVLAAITSQLVSSLDLRRVLQMVADQALLLAGADRVTLYLRDPDTGLLNPKGVSATANNQSQTLPPPPRPGGLTATVADSGEPAFIADAAAHPLYQDARYARLRAVAALPLRLEGGVLGVMNVVYEQRHPFDDGEIRMLTALADTSALAVHNATLHERIARMAVTDELTGLANRRRFLEVLRAEVQRARRYWRPLSLLMVDLDKLKAINDQHGHDAGDAVLRGLAQWLRGTVRDTDLAARLGGDEFALLLPETSGEAALAIAERLRAGMAAWNVDAGGVLVGSTVSIGLASCAAGDLPDLPGFLKLADSALYRAKAAGRNAIRAVESLYDSSIDAPA
jgi:diguanylate cyclase (GGDEF)-like protein